MKEAEIAEFKDVLKQFEVDLKSEIKSDPDYDGEADHLCQAIARLQTQFENINTQKDYDQAYEGLAGDLEVVMHAAVMFSDVADEEEEDFDEDEFEDDEEGEDEMDDDEELEDEEDDL
jgi:hypothetical protein